MTTAIASAHARRHTTSTVALAERMHSVGWSVYAIAKLLRRQGIAISETTVAGWVDPEFARRRRAQKNASYRRRQSGMATGGRLGGGQPRTTEFRMVRMRSLRAAGMSYEGIAIAMTFDFPGEPVTGDQARYALLNDAPPKAYRAMKGGADGR